MPHKDPEARLAYRLAYEAANREVILQRRAAYYATHRAERVAASVAYNRAHPEDARRRGRAASKIYYQKNREAIRARATEDRDYYRAYGAEWQRQHPERRAAYTRAYRYRKRGAAGSHTLQEWLEKVELLGGCCIYCGRDDVPMTEDHKVPLSRGGSDDITNIVPACHSCNARKRARTAHEFLGIAA